MTNQQNKRIEELKNNAIQIGWLGPKKNVEIKKFEVTEFEHSKLVFVSIELGLKNDEGTLAAALNRRIANICVGTKGGIKCCKIHSHNFKSVKYLFECFEFSL